MSGYVYRLARWDFENGAYGHISMCDSEGEYHSSESGHPCPSTDGIGYVDRRWFGFVGVRQARQWWYSLCDLMDWERAGAKLYILPPERVADLEVGERQCVFNRRQNMQPVFSLPASCLHTVREVELEQRADAFYAALPEPQSFDGVPL